MKKYRATYETDKGHQVPVTTVQADSKQEATTLVEHNLESRGLFGFLGIFRLKGKVEEVKS
jgi:hypothetical protein